MKPNKDRIRQRRLEVVKAALRARTIATDVQTREAAAFILGVFRTLKAQEVKKDE